MAGSSLGFASNAVPGGGPRDGRGEDLTARAIYQEPPTSSSSLDSFPSRKDDKRGGGGKNGKTEKIGILLLNLGGPECLDDVQPFLFNLFADPDIIRLPPQLQFLQGFLATLLSNSRAPKSREAYKAIGGGSPLRRITDEQAGAETRPLLSST